MEPFIGQIMQVAFNFAPRNWATCDGQLMTISQNSALFSLLGTMFGGNGSVTFGLPDLRGRSMAHVGQGLGLPAVQIGEAGGAAQHTLTPANLYQLFGVHFAELSGPDGTRALVPSRQPDPA